MLFVVSCSQFIRMRLAQIIFEFCVLYGQYIIDVPVNEIEPRCYIVTISFPLRADGMNSATCEQDVGEKRGAICIHWNADCLLEDFFRQKPRIYCQLQTQAS